jgi:hypothetical protein
MNAPVKPPERPVRTLSDGVANPKRGAPGRSSARPEPRPDPKSSGDADT